MSTYENYYDINPLSGIDQNHWTEYQMELALQWRLQPVTYSPLIDWNRTQEQTHAQTSVVTEMLEGDVSTAELPFTAKYIDVTSGVDSRSRTLSSTRYGDKVQFHETDNIFNQWRMGGSNDWRPLLRDRLGRNIIEKHEKLARNAFLSGPQSHWTYANSASSFNDIDSGHKFNLNVINEWNLRLGNTGTPVIPGDTASAKVCILPPGVRYDFMAGIATASQNEASMWRDAQIYSGAALKYEIGSHKGIRFVEVPNNRYGENLAVLYNAGSVSAQYGVTQKINMNDGSPDPASTSKVDDVWSVGQKDVTHYIQLESGADTSKFSVGDIVSIHTARTSAFGVTNGNDFRHAFTITRRIVAIDASNKRLSFDRPVLYNYANPFSATSVSGSAGTFYAFVTKAQHIGFCLVLGSRGGIMGSVARGIRLYEPDAIDDFKSVWRFVWDAYEGYNIWEPDVFECHFCAVTLPKAGGLITP